MITMDSHVVTSWLNGFLMLNWPGIVVLLVLGVLFYFAIMSIGRVTGRR